MPAAGTSGPHRSFHTLKGLFHLLPLDSVFFFLNQRTVENMGLGKDLCRSSVPHKAGLASRLHQVAQGHVQLNFENLRETPQQPQPPLPVPDHSYNVKTFKKSSCPIQVPSLSLSLCLPVPHLSAPNIQAYTSAPVGYFMCSPQRFC